MNVLDEYVHRIEWLKEARQKVEAGEVSHPVEIEFLIKTLLRYKKNPVREAVTFCGVDSGGCNTAEYKVKAERARKQYICEIAALQKAIAEQREAIERAKYAQPIIDEVRRLFAQEAPAQPNNAQSQQPRTFPKELDTPLARYVFNRFVDDGVMSRDGDFYRWEGKPLEYGVFVAVGSELLGLKECEGDRSMWKPFNIALQRTETEVKTARTKFSNKYSNLKNFNVLSMGRNNRGWRISYFFKQYVDEWKENHNK